MEENQYHTPQHRTGRRPAAWLCRGVLAFGLLFLGGCDLLDKALSVKAPGMVEADNMADPANAHLLVSGTIADFNCALGAYIVNGGLLGNELRDASVTAARFPLDSRNIDNSSPYGVNSCSGNPPGIYRPLATAIWTSNDALARLKAWTDAEVANRTNLIAQAAAYSGYSHVVMGEGFCTTVIEEQGPEVQSAQVFAVAEARFTEAIQAAQSADNETILNLAQLGRARSRLNQGKLAEAAADARAVLDRKPLFELADSTSSSSARRYNRVGAEFFSGNITVDLSYRDLTVAGQPDIRVATFDTNSKGHDSQTPVWMVAKYGTARAADIRNLPVPVATWREARLIIAEAEGGAEAVAQINALREHWGLPLFSSTDNAEIMRQVIEERSRELYLEGHHLWDLRRFNLPQTPAPGEPYRQGGVYGDVKCFQLPAVERNNNPNL
jgi:hypothetical protein